MGKNNHWENIIRDYLFSKRSVKKITAKFLLGKVNKYSKEYGEIDIIQLSRIMENLGFKKGEMDNRKLCYIINN